MKTTVFGVSLVAILSKLAVNQLALRHLRDVLVVHRIPIFPPIGLDVREEPAVEEVPADTVDETRVAEILAESPDADVVVVDEATYELAVADAAPDPSRPADPAPAEAEVVATGPAAAQPSDDATAAELEDAAAERSRSVPMPTFSEAPTAEIPAVTDDLRRIRGIGPSMERTLQGIGIVSYRQLALLDGAELERVRGELTDFRGRIEREDWVGQARALYREKYGRDPS